MKHRARTPRAKQSARLQLPSSLALACGALALALGACSDHAEPHPDPAGEQAAETVTGTERYVGRDACARCHAEELEAWRGSHHDLAMDEATPATVLGDFEDATFDYFGTTSRFFRRDDRYFVQTDGPDGELGDFEIAYVFGVTPLQQYLIPFADGRVQSLTIAWDSRPAEAGGQRWFSLYPDEEIRAGDELHWTGIQQSWNYQCAECHSTDLRRNYDADTDTFHTVWSEIDVSCEACHGPASRHVEWAERSESGAAPEADDGLVVHFNERRGVEWTIGFTPASARRSRERPTTKEIDTCSRCHARRGILTEDYVPGRSLLDTHRVSLLEDGLYEADGQMLDEVYNYGSFLQSKMYAKGVTCGDCHEPHSLALRETGNNMCLQCHASATYQSQEHHRHPAGTTGMTCVACHMATRTYMVVDPRHDHSFRVPRPDLSALFGTPNACNDCHTEPGEDAAWAAAAVAEWYGPKRASLQSFQRFTEALVAGREHGDRAGLQLAALALDAEAPAIARATALSLLPGYPPAVTFDAVRESLGAADPILRYGALLALDGAEPRTRWELGRALLHDPVRTVRTEAARALADAAPRDASEEEIAALSAALDEYVATQALIAERPESWANLGLLYLRLGDPASAESAYRRALALEPGFLGAIVNLADLARARGDDDGCERLLVQALGTEPDNADVHYALALLRARQRRLPEAVALLERAVGLGPRVPLYRYTLGVALDSVGQPERGMAVLEDALARFPGDLELLNALIGMYGARGDTQRALTFARRLLEQCPADPEAQAMVRMLEAE